MGNKLTARGQHRKRDLPLLVLSNKSSVRRFPAAVLPDQRPSRAACVLLWHMLEAACREITRKESITSKLIIKHKTSPPRQCCLGLALCVLLGWFLINISQDLHVNLPPQTEIRFFLN